MSNIVIAALYRFVRLDDYRELQQGLLEHMLENQVRGTLLLATEGINGTVAGSESAITRLLDYLRQDERFKDIDSKLSHADEMPFYRSLVKLKKEIVTLGAEGIDPARSAGTYVQARDWNALISDPEVTVVDTRNDYESAIGTFDKALIPGTRSFRDFPEYVKRNLDPQKHRKIAMFCTGGIRCEKSTAYLKQQGFDELYHLQGGILKYLEEVSESDSLWRGECFVFDQRVSVNHRLEKGSYAQCHACRLPVTDEDQRSSKYQPGVSCPACYGSRPEAERLGHVEREKQARLAENRGVSHFGVDANQHAELRRTQKRAAKDVQGRQSSLSHRR